MVSNGSRSSAAILERNLDQGQGKRDKPRHGERASFVSVRATIDSISTLVTGLVHRCSLYPIPTRRNWIKGKKRIAIDSKPRTKHTCDQREINSFLSSFLSFFLFFCFFFLPLISFVRTSMTRTAFRFAPNLSCAAYHPPRDTWCVYASASSRGNLMEFRAESASS